MLKKFFILIVLLIFSCSIISCAKQDELIELSTKADQLVEQQDAKYIKAIIQNISYYDELILQNKESTKVKIIQSDGSNETQLALAEITFWFLFLNRDLAEIDLKLLKKVINEKEYKKNKEDFIAQYKEDRIKYIKLIEDYIVK